MGLTNPIVGITVLLMESQVRDYGNKPGTATQRLASLLLDRDVLEFIRERRAAGRAWRFIVRDLYDATDGQVDVTHETLRNWYGEDAA